MFEKIMDAAGVFLVGTFLLTVAVCATSLLIRATLLLWGF